MSGLSAAGAASAPAHPVHLVHLGVVVVGLLGLAVILLPSLVQRVATPAPGRTPTVTAPDVRTGLPQEVAAQLALVRAARDPRPTAGAGGLTGSLWLPLAVVGSTVAAGVHAALVPPHTATLPALAGAFAVCAGGQLVWAAALLLRPAPSLLRAGITAQLGVCMLWALSRTTGLPPLQPAPEPLGAWDLLAVVAQLAAVTGGVLALRVVRRPGHRTAPWLDWHPAAHAATLLGVGVLALLALGAGTSTG